MLNKTTFARKVVFYVGNDDRKGISLERSKLKCSPH